MSAFSWAAEAWLPSSPHSLFRLPSLVCGLLLSVALLGSNASLGEQVSAATVLLLLLTNLVLALRESFLRSQEVVRRVELLATTLGQVAVAR